MPDLPTRSQLFERGAEAIESRGAGRSESARISGSELYTPGSDVNLLVGAASAMADEIVALLAQRIGALFLAGAEAEDLDRLVADRFSPTVVRREASAAVGFVEFRRTVTSSARSIPAGTRVQTADGIQFRTVFAETMGVGASLISARVQALEAGTGGNVAAGGVTTIVDRPAWLAADDLRVEQAAPMAGGDDQETDASLRARARDFFPQARRGTPAAIEFGALTVAGVRQATAVESLDAAGDPNGRVACYIADANGQGNAALVADVVAALREYRAAGIVVDVASGVPTLTPIVLRLRFDAGVDSSRAFARVRSAVVAAVNDLRPGEALEISRITAAARSVDGVIVRDDAVLEPVGDVIPEGAEVIRTASELVTPEAV